mgnify:CR=1 FL=1
MASVDMHDIDLKEFNEVLAACKGDVFMVTPEGDRLNLKSRLCQLIGFTKLIEGGSIAEAKLECSDPEDQRRLFRFNMFGEKNRFTFWRARIRGRFFVSERADAHGFCSFTVCLYEVGRFGLTPYSIK